MTAPTFETFDPSPYQRAPRGNVRSMLALARALAELAPRDESGVIERTANALVQVIEDAEEALTMRRRESVPVDLSYELALDACTDALWAAVRNGLEAKASFAHASLPVVLAKHGKRRAVAIAVREGQEQATRARALAIRLFGSEGLTFTQKTYAEQAESTAEILRLIDQDGLADELDALLGPQLLVALRACQVEYEAMVEDRMSRDDRKSADLARLRGKLQRAISRHCSAVLTLLDEDEPETLTQVLAALRPLEVHRAQLASSSRPSPSETAAEDDPGAPAEPAVAEAVA
ncbi:hypothetical protein [Paraliomyxa miuraensis]|uniref:hypothetical protein n=1 Tax=Paraliomyxa miuraensis TaxID=376150 RepID=UPI00224D0832|nr:hypothetical protein [Paraliomyxa miuraensis]MCX4241867.1 hypothetical protein [Paraliomyxa miuraensis]